MVKIIKICIIFLLMTGWIFSGWPQIWKNPSFPPEVESILGAAPGTILMNLINGDPCTAGTCDPADTAVGNGTITYQYQLNPGGNNDNIESTFQLFFAVSGASGGTDEALSGTQVTDVSSPIYLTSNPTIDNSGVGDCSAATWNNTAKQVEWTSPSCTAGNYVNVTWNITFDTGAGGNTYDFDTACTKNKAANCDTSDYIDQWGVVGAVAVTTIVDASTNNSTATIAPGGAATDAGRFSISDDIGGGSTISSVTVTFPANVVAGIALVQVWNAAETTGYLSETSPTSDTFVLTTGTVIPSSTTPTEFHILITPKSHASMPGPNGASYAATAYITACTSSAGGGCGTTDSADNTVTIDNLSPNDVTSTSGSVTSDTEITINWTTSSSVDYNRSIVLRWQAATPGADVPAEGTDYNLDDIIGGATVACVENTGTSSTVYSGVDGSGADECSSTVLSVSTQYSYKHFEKDDNGNWNTGVTNASSPLTTTGGVAPTLTFSISGDLAIGFGALSTSVATWATDNEDGSGSEVSAHTLTVSTNATNGYTITVNGTTLTSGGDTIDAIGDTAVDVTGGNGTEHFGIRLTASGTGTPTAPYNGDSNNYALDTSAFPDEVASGAGDGTTTTFSVFYAANIAATTEAHTDYTSTLTYIATGNF